MAKPRLIYLANSRLPTEKAHGLQIVQMCEAFAQAGYDVTLVTSRRRNTPDLRAVESLWDHYGVERNFTFRRLPCLDLIPIAPPRLQQPAFLLQTITYMAVLWVWLLFRRADVVYTRDLFVAALVTLTRSRRRLAYEAHRVNASRLGRRLQRYVARRAVSIPITGYLGDRLREIGAPPARVMVAHDGIRQARFANMPTQAEARAAIGWPENAFIVGWIGRLHLTGIDKGVGLLVDALRDVDGASLAVVGGPEDMAETLRRRWLDLGLDAERFLYAGHVPPERVPVYLSAFDVCAMPHPWSNHFAYYTSPLKLFEYMASGRAIVASNLPGFAEVVRDGESALLVPPGDATALAEAIIRLRDDPALRHRLAEQALNLVMSRHTWDARAWTIRQAIEHGSENQDSP